MEKEDLLYKAAEKLSNSLMNKIAGESLPKELASIVKLHSKLAIASSLIPVPGADLLASIANIWAMYARINEEIGVPFSENVMKSVATGIATNLGIAFLGSAIIGSVLKIIPGLGSVGGSFVVGATVYAMTITSGIIYMNALSLLLSSGATLREESIKEKVNEIMKDKNSIKNIMNEAKKSYKTE